MNNNMENSNAYSNNNLTPNDNQSVYNNTFNSSLSINKNVNSNFYNVNNEINKKILSKKAKILMFSVLISTLIIFFDKLILSMDWYTNLLVQAILNHDEQLKLVLDYLDELVNIINWTIVLIITIISIIFFKKDKQMKNNTDIYIWYIVNGILHIIIGTIGLTPFIYSGATLSLSIKNKKINGIKNKSDRILNVFSFIVFFLVAFTFIALQINLFDSFKKNVDNYNENRNIIIEDNDNSHVITTFDKLIDDWGNNPLENKKFKIKNVKLKNVTASLYIDYDIVHSDKEFISTIKIMHGDSEIYNYSEKNQYFNLSYFTKYDDLILYGASYCDSVEDGICNKHLTYSQLVAFNKSDNITLYNRTEFGGQGSGITFYREKSEFLEDESVYAKPYNDFRVYNVEIKNDDIYIYTVVENYDDIFNDDYNFREKNCKDPLWISITFDMQRIFKTKFTYDEVNEIYNLEDLLVIDSVTYSDYCANRNVLNFQI